MFFKKHKDSVTKFAKFNTVIEDEDQGIPKKDLLALLSYVQERNLILLIRPVEPLSKILHESGSFPTKPFHIKGKSATWGPWASFIPINQAYSKLSGTHAGKIEKANKDIQDCIMKKMAQARHLIITENRFQELQNKKIIYPQKQKEDDYLIIECPRSSKEGDFEVCYAKRIENASGIEYAIFSAEKKPFQVLADTVLNKPFIPDYDLLAIFSPWKNFNQEHIRINPEITLQERHRRLSPREQHRLMENEQNFYGREDRYLGNVSAKTKKIISELNNALKKTEHLACIHHNDDVGSPASDPAANYPITALLPRRLAGLPEMLLIKSENEFVNFIETINQFEYRVEANPLWEKTVQLAAKENFYQTLLRLEHSKGNFDGLRKSLRKILIAIGVTDATLNAEITNVVLLALKCSIAIKFEEFFKTIKSCLLVNSVLVSQWCRLLENVLTKNLLTNEVFFKIQQLVVNLKEDISGFFELSTTIINLENLLGLQSLKLEEKLDYLLNCANNCIVENKLDKIAFNVKINEGINGFIFKSTEKLTAVARFTL